MGHALPPEAINSLGLSLDILGTILLFFFGVPSDASLDGVLTAGRGRGKDYKRAVFWSRVGLAAGHLVKRALPGLVRENAALQRQALGLAELAAGGATSDSQPNRRPK